jgi:hypothetical protein
MKRREVDERVLVQMHAVGVIAQDQRLDDQGRVLRDNFCNLLAAFDSASLSAVVAVTRLEIPGRNNRIESKKITPVSDTLRPRLPAFGGDI